MRDLQGKRIAAYARYSTDRQNAASIADQLRVCREYAERRGGTVDDTLVFTDRAISGASAARPGLHALQDAVNAGVLDVVLTEDLSRIGRSVGNNDRFLKELSRGGARLIAINDGFDTGERKAKLLGAVKSAMAEDYLDELKERTKRGMDGLFEAGMHTGGRVFGYKSVTLEDGSSRRRLAIDDSQADVVRRIYTLYADGHSQKRIAYLLNQDGIASPRGGQWGHIAIRTVLHNELYAGTMIFNRRAYFRDETTGKRRAVTRPKSEWRSREDESLRIVSEELYQLVRSRMASDGKVHSKGSRPKRIHPLSGLLKCSLCDADMVIAGNGYYYRCASAQRAHGCENRRSLPERAIRKWLLDKIVEVAGPDDLLRQMRAGLAQAIGDHHRQIRRELTERQTSFTKVQQRLSKVLDLIIDGDDSADMRNKRSDLQEQGELLRSVVRRLESQLEHVLELPSIEDLQRFLKSLPEIMLGRPQEAKELLRLMLMGPLECTPPSRKGGDYTIAFQLSSDWVMATSSRLDGRELVSVSCGGPLLPQTSFRRVVEKCPHLYGL